ncbi:MAG: hypothetical protein JHD35_25860 [Sphingopyxis sp.]|nr:hypothetical protein [Sphingopyxis sp.]
MALDKDEVAKKIIVNGLIDVDFYNFQIKGQRFTGNTHAAIHYVNIGESEGIAPSAFFDPVYYAESNPDLSGSEILINHYIDFGREEGRHGSLASHLMAENLDKLAVDEAIIPPFNNIGTNFSYIENLAISLQSIDKDLRYFSSKYYLTRHADIQKHNLNPVVHYLKYGLVEGRVTNVELLDNIHMDEGRIDSTLPFILIGVHEASTTGAPIVGMDLALEMQGQYNVIFLSLRDGPLIDRARAAFPVVVTATHSDDDNRFFVDLLTQNFAFEQAIFSSSACVSFIRPLASKNCKITCLVHEFLEYMISARSILYVCDLLVFSSRELLKSWQYMLDDVGRAPETVMVLPQPASAASSRKMAKEEARTALEKAMDLDLDGATLVLGAGQIQIRKGTDIFLQIGNQLQREVGKFVTVWIGQQISEFDMGFGVWFHAQMERSRDPSGKLAVHFAPPGPLYPVLMDAADVFLVTSRLDPLPNVALDAAARDIPVIAFAGATGLADLAEKGQINLIEVEIAAVDEVIAAIRACASPVPMKEHK